MSEPIPFRRGAVAPFEVFGEALRLVSGQYWLLVGITVFAILLGAMAPMGVLLGPMYCGLYGCYRDKWQGRVVKFETLFKGGFDSVTFLQSFLATLLMMAAGLTIFLPLLVIGVAAIVFAAALGNSRSGSPNGAVALLMGAGGGAVLLWLAATMILGALFSFTYPLIMDRRLPALDAVKLSARAAWANFGGLLGLAFIGLVAGVLGLCALYVGAFLVAPFTFGAHAVAYERVFGFANAGPEPSTKQP
jgi:hypothetical protein